jgi:hypothetical protein
MLALTRAADASIRPYKAAAKIIKKSAKIP